jgi:hypothetical protein
MPVTYKIFPEYVLLVTWPSGLVSSEELIEAYRKVYADPQLQPGFHELVDLRRVSAFDVSAAAFRMITSMTEDFQGGTPTRTAMLVDQTMNEIISRLYQSIAETGGSEVVAQFTELTEALAWLERRDFPPELLERGS